MKTRFWFVGRYLRMVIPYTLNKSIVCFIITVTTIIINVSSYTVKFCKTNWHWCKTCIVQSSGIGSSLTNEDETFDTMNIPSAVIRSTSIVIISINNNKKRWSRIIIHCTPVGGIFIFCLYMIESVDLLVSCV